MADVRTTAFTKVIKDQLFSGSEFLMYSTSHDAFVKDKTVEIPISGTIPDVEEDRSSYPITVVDRTDDKQTYNLIEFSLGAIRLPEKDTLELSYDKAASIVRQHMNKVNDRIALRGMFNWAQAVPSLQTSATAVAGINSPGATGNRKPLGMDDIAKAAAKLDEDKVRADNRYMVIPSKMYWQFVEANKAYLLNLDYNKNLSNEDISTGVVAKVFGFKLIPRAYTVVFDNSDALKAVGASTATTDQWGIIGWQMDEVCRALGSIKVYLDKDNAVYQSDIYSATLRFNAKQMRKDGTGVVTILQDT